MAYLTGMFLLDAPASALNNAGSEPGAKTENTIAVKKIRSEGKDFPYVSAQSFRFWLRTTLEHGDTGWVAAPVFREKKIAFSESDPITNWDDDLFGYMRAQSKKGDADERKKNAEQSVEALPLEKDREVTRVSPFRVSTFVSVSPASIVSDFGTMARQDGNPVPHEHEFYRAHLRGLVSLDLTSCGTFYHGERVGYKNLDSYRVEKATGANCEEITVRKQKAYRLPLEKRVERVSALVKGLANLSGGAKQTLHYTDLMPAVSFFAVTKSGNHPFYRVFNGTKTGRTELHEGAIREVFESFYDDLVSPVYIGWAQGFLDEERAKFDALKSELKTPHGIEEVAHPRSVLLKLSEELSKHDHEDWYA
ncbi:MAG TPA: type I-B CRISPR-associated protein Cas7/Cst2/DevR [Planctomicrobium sp.]|nr:type I-B CRISPR-associated protein Cas7/Cst2/DevR [Planctomicrobium sp.]